MRKARCHRAFLVLALSLGVAHGCSDADQPAQPVSTEMSSWIAPSTSLAGVAERSTGVAEAVDNVDDRYAAQELFLRILLGPTGSQAAAVNEGVGAFLRDCWLSRGYQPGVIPVIVNTPDQSALAELVDRVYFNNPEYISVNGYGTASRIDDGGQQGAVTDDPGECMDELGKKLRVVDAEFPLPDIYRADAEVQLTMASDAGLSLVGQSWSSCMAALGYEIEQPLRPLDPSRDTIEVALVDMECQTSTGYREARIEMQVALVSDWIEAHPDLVAAAEAHWEGLAALGVELAGAENPSTG